MNAITKPPATRTDREWASKALDSAIHLRDAVYALRLIVTHPWDGRHSADAARNAIDWISQKMEEECDTLHDVLEDPDLGEARA